MSNKLVLGVLPWVKPTRYFEERFQTIRRQEEKKEKKERKKEKKERKEEKKTRRKKEMRNGGGSFSSFVFRFG